MPELMPIYQVNKRSIWEPKVAISTCRQIKNCPMLCSRTNKHHEVIHGCYLVGVASHTVGILSDPDVDERELHIPHGGWSRVVLHPQPELQICSVVPEVHILHIISINCISSADPL